MAVEATSDKLLELTFQTEDAREREICEAYWTCTLDGNFPEAITAVGRRFGISIAAVNATVERCCVAIYRDCVCLKCNKPTGVFSRRYQFTAAYQVLNSKYDYCNEAENYHYCAPCREEIKREELADRERAKLEMMRKAFDASVYQSLEPLEFNFLVQLASCYSKYEAQKRVGLAPKDAAKLLEKFDTLNLIDWRSGPREAYDDLVKMLDELRNMLKGETLQRRVKSIFGSAKALEVFRKLKKDHAFVFPEILLCAFVEKEHVEHLFEQGDFSYFLTCRIDFLVCEQDGTPKCAIEYQGGYHCDPQQTKRDDFKRRILSAVGISLTTLTSAELKNEEALP